MTDTFHQLPDTTIDQIMLANTAWPDFRLQHKQAINTTIGVLIDPDTSMPWQPRTVVEARSRALKDIQAAHNHGYQTQSGNSEFLIEAGRMVFGNELYENLADDGLLAYQTLGGTGALSLTKDVLLSLLVPNREGKLSLLLDPGWPNHPAIFQPPFAIETYEHVDAMSGQYNHKAALEAVSDAPKHPVLLLQTCGYNDDGVDRTRLQWTEILDAAQEKEAIVILDSAYLGLARGLEQDRYAIEQCLQRDLLTFICVSFSKNMGLYNERLGALYIAKAKPHITDQQLPNLDQLVKRIVRRTISSPPLLVAQSAATVLKTTEYYAELEKVRLGIVANRQAFSAKLQPHIPHAGEGYGLFTKLLPQGFTKKQTAALADDGILTLPNSRINLGGMALDQVDRVATAISSVLKK